METLTRSAPLQVSGRLFRGCSTELGKDKGEGAQQSWVAQNDTLPISRGNTYPLMVQVTLQFQIEMTSTASNVLFGYWSHDLGGFHNGTLHDIKDVVGDEDPHNVTGSEMCLTAHLTPIISP